MQFRSAMLFVLSIVLISCGGDLPTGPSGAVRTNFSVRSMSPQKGAMLTRGDDLFVSGSYTKEKTEWWDGIAVIRDDGATWMSTVSGGGSRHEGSVGMGSSLTSGNGLYEFARGHRIDFLFVLGEREMLNRRLRDFSVDYEFVRYQQLIPAGYIVK